MKLRAIRWPVLGTLGSLVLSSFAFAVQPQPQAHAHNDYHHPRPLLDAMSHGFCSVEADVFAIDGELLVAHDRVDAKPGRTLQKLYLDPLRAAVRANGGRVYKSVPTFTLLIDFKSAAEPTYQVLRDLLADYRDILVRQQDGRELPGPVSIVISGNRPFDLIAADEQRMVGIDGRLKDLDSDMSADLMPLISDNWMLHFRWDGTGEMPAAERVKLRQAVKKAHDAGRRIRFWATPENEMVWNELAAAGVDHINTDQLARLEEFLRSRALTSSG